MPDDRWEALVDDAIHEINMRWGVALDDSDEPDMDLMDPTMVRETAEAILQPLYAEIAGLKDLRGVQHRAVHRDDAVIITGAEYLRKSRLALEATDGGV